MSFIVKGGFNTFRQHLINITLFPTRYWLTGTISTEDKQLYSILNSSQYNTIECDKYGDNYVLLLNKRVLYASKQMFTYDVSLNFSDKNDFSAINMYSFMEFKQIVSL